MMLAVKRIGRKSLSLLSLSPKCLRLAESSRRPDDHPGKAGCGVSLYDGEQCRGGWEIDRESAGAWEGERAPIRKLAPQLHPVNIFLIPLLVFLILPSLNGYPSSGFQLLMNCFHIICLSD